MQKHPAVNDRVLFFYVFHYILDPAVKYLTKAVDGDRLHNRIVAKSLQLRVVDTVFLYKLVLADALFLERFPQWSVAYHIITSIVFYL